MPRRLVLLYKGQGVLCCSCRKPFMTWTYPRGHLIAHFWRCLIWIIPIHRNGVRGYHGGVIRSISITMTFASLFEMLILISICSTYLLLFSYCFTIRRGNFEDRDPSPLLSSASMEELKQRNIFSNSAQIFKLHTPESCWIHIQANSVQPSNKSMSITFCLKTESHILVIHVGVCSE